MRWMNAVAVPKSWRTRYEQVAATLRQLCNPSQDFVIMRAFIVAGRPVAFAGACRLADPRTTGAGKMCCALCEAGLKSLQAGGTRERLERLDRGPFAG